MRIDTLRLLLAAEPDGTVEGIELLMSEIVARLDTLDPDSDAYRMAHQRLDHLLTLRADYVKRDSAG